MIVFSSDAFVFYLKQLFLRIFTVIERKQTLIFFPNDLNRFGIYIKDVKEFVVFLLLIL